MEGSRCSFSGNLESVLRANLRTCQTPNFPRLRGLGLERQALPAAPCVLGFRPTRELENACRCLSLFSPHEALRREKCNDQPSGMTSPTTARPASRSKFIQDYLLRLHALVPPRKFRHDTIHTSSFRKHWAKAGAQLILGAGRLALGQRFSRTHPPSTSRILPTQILPACYLFHILSGPDWIVAAPVGLPVCRILDIGATLFFLAVQKTHHLTRPSSAGSTLTRPRGSNNSDPSTGSCVLDCGKKDSRASISAKPRSSSDGQDCVPANTLWPLDLQLTLRPF